MPRFRWRKIGRGVAVSVALMVALYEIGANALLSSGAIARLVSLRPEKLRLAYASARTFWPGLVHVEGLDLRGRSAHIEWQLHIDEADADISLRALLRRRFHVSEVKTVGVTFRTRFRLEPDAVDADRVARMPPIEGFEAVPVVGVPPETSDEKAKPWTIDIQKVDARAVREVWIDAYRVAGRLRVKGGFTLGSNVLTVAPASADVESIALTTGDDPIASDVEGRLDAQVDTVDLGAIKGAAVLRYLTARATLRGRMGGIRFLRHLVRDDAVALSGGEGTFRCDANVVRGLVASGTTSRIELAPARVVLSHRQIDGRADIAFTTGEVDGANATGWGDMRVGLSDLALIEPDAADAAVSCPKWTTTVRTPQLDLADPLAAVRELSYEWEAPRVDVLDLRAVDAAIPKESPFHIERGTATMSTRGRGSLAGATAEIGLASELVTRMWGARVSSGLKGTLPLKASFAAETLDLSGAELTLSDPALAGWWSKVHLGATTVRLDNPSLTLAASVTARDGRPFLAFYAAMSGASPVARTVLGVVPAPLIESMTADLHGGLRLAASKGAIDLHGLDVQGASSRLRGVLKKRGGLMDGRLLVEAGVNALGISFAAGQTSLVLVGAPKWFEGNGGP
jgi:hypothetical protein